MPSTPEIIKRIEALESYIAGLTEGLPYADHGAYGQDRERIRIAQLELNRLTRQLEETRRP